MTFFERAKVTGNSAEPLNIGDGMGLDLLRAVYRNPTIDLHVRMRAAALSLPYESPRLAVTAVIDNQKDFGAILERRMKHMDEVNRVRELNGNGSAKLIEAPRVIEATPVVAVAPTAPISKTPRLLRRI